MKTLLRTAFGAAVLVLGASGCKTDLSTSGAEYRDNHWNINSLDERIVKQFTGYEGALDGGFWTDYRRRRSAARRLTLRRHFLNNNPYNPFQPLDKSVTRPTRDLGDPPPVRKFKVKNR